MKRAEIKKLLKTDPELLALLCQLNKPGEEYRPIEGRELVRDFLRALRKKTVVPLCSSQDNA